MTEILEHRGSAACNHNVVIDNEHAERTPAIGALHCFRGYHPVVAATCRRGQPELDIGADLRPAADPHDAPGLSEEAIDHRQSQTGAASRSFGGEKRLC